MVPFCLFQRDEIFSSNPLTVTKSFRRFITVESITAKANSDNKMVTVYLKDESGRITDIEMGEVPAEIYPS